MATPPTRREQRTALSRGRILDAAIEVLVERGYAGTSTLLIQQRAGVSRGRLLHHFPSKDDLLLAAARHLVEARMDDLAGAWERTKAAPASPQRIDEAVGLLWTTFRQPYFWASVELWIAARHNPDLARVLGPQERKLYRLVRHTVDLNFGPAVTSHPRWPATRELLFTSMRGVALTYAFGEGNPARDKHLPEWRAVARSLLVPELAPAPG
jgi:AcrR family transcriptional regulator